MQLRPANSLVWSQCGASQCAEVEVPIDYAAPELGTIKIAINRIQANTREVKGVIFVNPGGPGASGRPFVVASLAGLRATLPGYDFVGFDPRGVGGSAPLTCSQDLDLIEIFQTGGVPALIDQLRSWSQLCASENGPLFDKVGSNQVVADVDRVRAALGYEQINAPSCHPGVASEPRWRQPGRARRAPYRSTRSARTR